MIDVLVIGGGNAALCAALTAREAGRGFRGGLGVAILRLDDKIAEDLFTAYDNAVL